MQESYEKGLAPRSASTFASGAARYLAKSKQRYRWAGYRASKNCNQDADALDFVVIDPRHAWRVRARERETSGMPIGK
jgi:hypothetical protein